MNDQEIKNEIQIAFLKLHNIILDQQIELIRLRIQLASLNNKIDLVSSYSGAN